jgi:hypothetical protein
MKIIAILALLVPSVVTAAPTKNETAERVSYNDRAKAEAPPDDDSVELASATPCSHGREFVTVDGSYAQLRIESAKGRPVVKTVGIIFKDGTQRVVKVERAVKRPAVIDIKDNRVIDRVVITADWRAKGSYVVRGIPATGGVASR